MNYKTLLENNNFIITGDYEKINIRDYFFDDPNVYNLGDNDILSLLTHLYDKYVVNEINENLIIIINSLSAIFESKEREEIYVALEKLLTESKIRFAIWGSGVSLPRRIKRFFKLTVYDKSYASRMCNYQLEGNDITGITYNGSFYKVKNDYSIELLNLPEKESINEESKVNITLEDKELLSIYEYAILNKTVSLKSISEKFGIGFNKAKRIIDNFETIGLVKIDNKQVTFNKSFEEAKTIIKSI